MASLLNHNSYTDSYLRRPFFDPVFLPLFPVLIPIYCLLLCLNRVYQEQLKNKGSKNNFKKQNFFSKI